MTRSGIDELKRALSALELVDDLPASRAVRVCARLSDVSVEGSVEALNRKGRQFLIYELELSAKWRATLASAGAPAADGAAEGEDDEALARRLQAEEDARAGELSGSVQLGEWTHDEEDCPPIELKLSTARPFGAEVDGAGVRACATRLVERGLARALAEWARATRERVRAGGGGTPPVARPPPGTADGTAAKPAGVPVRASSPASPAASNAAAGGGSSGAAASASRASPLAAAAGADSGQRLRSALGTFCARGDGERGALSLKGLGLGDAEVPTLIECLHSRACAPTTSVDLSANALTDGGVAQVLDALHAPGCAPALRALQLGGTRASPASAQRATALRERRAQLVVAFDGVDPAAKGTRCLCVVGTAHAGARRTRTPRRRAPPSLPLPPRGRRLS